MAFGCGHQVNNSIACYRFFFIIELNLRPSSKDIILTSLRIFIFSYGTDLLWMWRQPWILPYLPEHNRYENKALLNFRFQPRLGSSAVVCTVKRICCSCKQPYITILNQNNYVSLGLFVYIMNRYCLIVYIEVCIVCHAWLM
jgi:hypothetical protein